MKRQRAPGVRAGEEGEVFCQALLSTPGYSLCLGHEEVTGDLHKSSARGEMSPRYLF